MINGIFHHLQAASNFLIDGHLEKHSCDELAEAHLEGRNSLVNTFVPHLEQNREAENDLERPDCEKLPHDVLHGELQSDSDIVQNIVFLVFFLFSLFGFLRELSML